jgi:Tol biopolymer transport system component
MKQSGNSYQWLGFTAVSVILLAMVGVMARFTAAAPLTGTTTVVSVDEQGNVGLFPSTQPAISGDGRFVAFASTYLVSEDTTYTDDVYVHDRQTGEPGLVSVASDGTLGNGWSHSPDISGDGRYVVFASNASNLVTGDTNGTVDVFLHDRQTGETSRISVDSDGDQVIWDSNRPVISGDGRYVAFRSLGDFESGLVTEGYDLFLKDRQTGEVTLVSATYDGSLNIDNAQDPFISATGDYILFWSYGDMFVADDDNDASDVFFYDRQADELSLVSVSSDGEQGNMDSEVASVTSDGRYVAFDSQASNLVAGDINGLFDIFLHDRQTGETTRISNGLGGAQTNGDSKHPMISADGRYIVFTSIASNLVANDTNGKYDIFVYNRETEEISLVSVSKAGVQGNDTSYFSDVSADGQHIAFQSQASNLVADDDNDNDDIFVHSLDVISGATHFVYLPFVTR